MNESIKPISESHHIMLVCIFCVLHVHVFRKRVFLFDSADLGVFAVGVLLLVVAGVDALSVRAPLLRVDDLVHPAPEAADPRVQRRRGRVSAAVTSRDDPGQNPSSRLVLTHQPASGVALATVAAQEAGVRRAGCTKRAVAGEAVSEALLALPWRHQRNPGSN